jgi:DNA-binding LacI/PurR family transcriptional regulator
MEVAKLAGVSQSAVSRTFTVGASVSERTRKKVVKAAKAVGYSPNIRLSRSRENIDGIIPRPEIVLYSQESSDRRSPGKI